MKPAETGVPTTPEEIREFLERAEGGDTSTRPILRQMLQDPGMVELCGGDLAHQAEDWFIQSFGSDNLAWREAIRRKLELLRAELAGPNPTPVERLLVERIVACWLQVQDADMRYAQAKNISLASHEYCQRRMDRAHRGYLSAIKTLALVRKLAVPVLQLNIARKQLNVAGVCPAAASERDSP
jgi:hypothetical protein